MILLFYYLMLYQKDTPVTPLCMQLHFSGENGKYHCCVFQPANRHTARRSLVEIKLTLKQLFAYFKVIKCIK